MKNKKTDTKHTNPTGRKIDEGAPVPRIQPIVEPEYKKGATVPDIQPITQPPGDTTPPTGTPPPTDPQPPTGNQPANNTPKPEPSGVESSK